MKISIHVLKSVDDLLQICSTCETRKELNRKHGAAFSHIDGYCNKECPIGAELQELGKKMSRAQ